MPPHGRLLPGSEFLIDDKRSIHGVDSEEAGRLKHVSHKVIGSYPLLSTCSVLDECQLLKASGNGDDPHTPAQ